MVGGPDDTVVVKLLFLLSLWHGAFAFMAVLAGLLASVTALRGWSDDPMTLVFFVGGLILAAVGVTTLMAMRRIAGTVSFHPWASLVLGLPFVAVTAWLAVYREADRGWWLLPLALLPGALLALLPLAKGKSFLMG